MKVPKVYNNWNDKTATISSWTFLSFATLFAETLDTLIRQLVQQFSHCSPSGHRGHGCRTFGLILSSWFIVSSSPDKIFPTYVQLKRDNKKTYARSVTAHCPSKTCP